MEKVRELESVEIEAETNRVFYSLQRRYPQVFPGMERYILRKINHEIRKYLRHLDLSLEKLESENSRQEFE